jgi:hypothetical protein
MWPAWLVHTLSYEWVSYMLVSFGLASSTSTYTRGSETDKSKQYCSGIGRDSAVVILLFCTTVGGAKS